MSLSLTPRCSVCNGKDNLLKCQGCMVTVYCGKDHQTSDRPAHKNACNGVKKAQKTLDTEEARLRAFPGDFMTASGAELFTEYVGHFWGITETRPYMPARYGLVDSLLKIQTYEAVSAAHENILDMLRFCRSDNMGVRDLAPPLFMRLGKDQACYDFCKWYATEGQRGDYDWGDMDLPFLNLKDEDVFEPIDLWTRKYFDLSHTITIALMKFRLLLDIRSLQNTNLVGGRIPQELMDNIRGGLVSSVVAGNKDIMESKDQSKLIKKLESQVKDVFVAVKGSNKYFWPALLNPGRHLTAEPEAYSSGSLQEMQLMLRYQYQAWVETPGAIDMINELSKKY